MWAPRDVAELRTRLQAGTLEETTTFDGKREIPKDNASTAVDLCAMTVQGGVIVYGVDEEPSGTRLTEAKPIPLAGARERLDQIAQTAIAEPPQLSITTLEEPDQPGEGYVIAAIPPSPRAPHQIVAKGKYEGRFYGRGATGNRILPEAEVAALVARRARWEQGAELGLDGEFTEWADEQRERERGRVCQVLKAVPLLGDDGLVERVAGPAGGSDVRTQLNYALQVALNEHKLQRTSPHPSVVLGQLRRQDADAWGAAAFDDENGPDLALSIARNGTTVLASRRVGDTIRSGRVVVFEEGVADNSAVFTHFVGNFLHRTGYTGPVALGTLVAPLEGAFSMRREQSFFRGEPYGAVRFRRELQVLAGALLADPVGTARRLIEDLTTALVGEGYDPFAS